MFPLLLSALQTTIAIDPSAASSGVIYTSGSALAAKACRIMGYLTWNSGLTTAGTWSAGPDVVQFHEPGMRCPADVVQKAGANFSSGSGSNTTSTSYVDTNVTKTITLTSPANTVAWSFSIQSSIATASAEEFFTMSRGGISIGPQVAGAFGPAAGANVLTTGMDGADFPGYVGPIAYTVRAKSSSGATVYWNDANGGASIELDEVMN